VEHYWTYGFVRRCVRAHDGRAHILAVIGRAAIASNPSFRLMTHSPIVRGTLEVRRKKDGEPHEDAVREQRLLTVVGILESTRSGANRFEPGQVLNEGAFVASLHDGEEVQVGVLIESVQFDSD
jgi:hypothetical protein